MRFAVHVESIITQLVFEHALRIRVKAETSKVDFETPVVRSETPSLAEAPAAGLRNGEEGSASDDETLHSTAHSAAHSRDDTLRASSTSGGQSHSGSLKGVPGAKSPAPVAESETAAKASSGKENQTDSSKNLVGMLNNLVSTSLL